MKIAVVIPARYASSRLPGKPLVDLCGKTMIRRVVEQCSKAKLAENVVVLTDSLEIMEEVSRWNGKAVMTPVDCLTGTDRCAAFAQEASFDYYVNVQGDEPLLDPDDLDKIIGLARKNPEVVLNGYAAIKSEDEYFSPHIPKVVMTPSGKLLYMSRSPIPGNKQQVFARGYRQICIYGFPKQSLLNFASQNNKSPLEKEEDIEILRFLEMGEEVHMIELSGNSIAVDRMKDVEIVRRILSHG